MNPRICTRPFTKCIRPSIIGRISSRSLASFTPAARSPRSEAGSAAQPPRRQQTASNWMRLLEVPTTALHSDIRQALSRSGVTGRFDVYLEYYRFLRRDSAYIKFENKIDAKTANEKIGGRGKFQISGHDVVAIAANQPSNVPGIDRSLSLDFGPRGTFTTGSGPDAGLFSRGTSVCLYGLPGRIQAEDVEAALRGFALRKPTRREQVVDDDPQAAEEHLPSVNKLAHNGRSLTSRHLVQLENISEAHRLVRQLHMTYWDEHTWGTKYICRARVVY
ncbi:hypothetical protein DACRYDRAFT_20149 [Dacryopinax primogenitus]|uniref:RRM domain-containing protein n=1 Tax=Dacryopinax primogenitus (strain DJM 731) TaxID=1858805 RepID=M5G680_DACPD|nr:uncharacterized protein DACRYDRAFT_20149 [Dacryopinax primogenitus]EJU05766.1 hypothetical protein DACRYDRAFT_20149 [Dacryopinax primogenitus]